MSDVVKLFVCLKNQMQVVGRKKLVREKFDRMKIIYPFRLILHPFDSFWDLKYEGKASIGIANALLAMLFVSNILTYFCTGYIFNTNEPSQFNILMELLYSVVLIVLWCVSNWAVCTLMDGEGTFREIWIATCYSLLPRILGQLIMVVLSNFIVLEEQIFWQILNVLSFGLTILLVLFGMLVVHQYTLSKALASALLSVAGVIIILFIVLLFFSILQQATGFIQTVYSELLNKS
ncbi:MAG: Yip1 family protein [Clostridiales bacterium]|nr:Yip1 family protein [Clostridiales bacterium]